MSLWNCDSRGFLYGDDNMPYKPKKPCAHRGCPDLTSERYCEAHKKADMKRYNRYERDPKSAKRYGSQWRKIRREYLAAFPLCEICKDEGRLTPATTVHHRKPLSQGGTNSFENLQALCGPCHSRLHAKQRDYF